MKYTNKQIKDLIDYPFKMEYTQKQIDDLIDYLGYCVKEGYLDDGMAFELIRTKDWRSIDEMRDKADAYAEAMIKGEI